MAAKTITARMNEAVAEYQRLRAAVVTERRPTTSEIAEKIGIIELILAEYGQQYRHVSGDYGDPGYYVGVGVGYDDQTNRLELYTDDEMLQKFPFAVTYTEIREWARAREREELEAIPY